MPCDSRIFVELDLSKADPNIFAEAMRRLGKQNVTVNGTVVQWSDDYGYIQFDSKTGQLQGSRYSLSKDAQQDMKRGYQREQSIMMAKKAGWSVKIDKKNQWRLSLSKR